MLNRVYRVCSMQYCQFHLSIFVNNCLSILRSLQAILCVLQAVSGVGVGGHFLNWHRFGIHEYFIVSYICLKSILGSVRHYLVFIRQYYVSRVQSQQEFEVISRTGIDLASVNICFISLFKKYSRFYKALFGLYKTILCVPRAVSGVGVRGHFSNWHRFGISEHLYAREAHHIVRPFLLEE